MLPHGTAALQGLGKPGACGRRWGVAAAPGSRLRGRARARIKPPAAGAGGGSSSGSGHQQPHQQAPSAAGGLHSSASQQRLAPAHASTFSSWLVDEGPNSTAAAAGAAAGAAAAAEAEAGEPEHPAAAAEVGELLLRRWLGIDSAGHLPVKEVTSQLRDTHCKLTVCATVVAAGQRKHVLLAVVVTEPGAAEAAAAGAAAGSDKPAATMGSAIGAAARTWQSGGSGRGHGKHKAKLLHLAELPQPMLHWGCAAARGDKWQPPAIGWSTWPDVSHDARHGAWQTPFTPQPALPGVGPALTLLLQLPWEAAVKHGGLAFLLKTSSNKWLGNGDTRADFFFDTSCLPEMPLISTTPAAGVGARADADAAQEGFSGLVGPQTTLDTEKMSKPPPPPPPPPAPARSASKQQHHTNDVAHHHSKWEQHNNKHHHKGEPELPNAGRFAKEPSTDETQVCTLSARELRSAAAAQLGAWLQQHTDLELPPQGFEVVQHEFPVKGHPSTPFVVATTVMMQRVAGGAAAAAAAGSNGARGGVRTVPVLLVAALADIGVTGTRTPGLVLSWAATADARAAAAAPDEQQAVGDLPPGWRTQPEMCWDAGMGFWDTPMTRELLEAAASSSASNGSGNGSSSSNGNGKSNGKGTSGKDTSGKAKQAERMYMALVRLPLQGVFSTGGVLMTMHTARRQWVRHGSSGGLFFLDTSAHAASLAAAAAAKAAVKPSGSGASSNGNGKAKGAAAAVSSSSNGSSNGSNGSTTAAPGAAPGPAARAAGGPPASSNGASSHAANGNGSAATPRTPPGIDASSLRDAIASIANSSSSAAGGSLAEDQRRALAAAGLSAEEVLLFEASLAAPPGSSGASLAPADVAAANAAAAASASSATKEALLGPAGSVGTPQARRAAAEGAATNGPSGAAGARAPGSSTGSSAAVAGSGAVPPSAGGSRGGAASPARASYDAAESVAERELKAHIAAQSVSAAAAAAPAVDAAAAVPAATEGSSSSSSSSSSSDVPRVSWKQPSPKSSPSGSPSASPRGSREFKAADASASGNSSTVSSLKSRGDVPRVSWRQPTPRASPSASPSGSPAASPRGSREFKADAASSKADASSASSASSSGGEVPRVSWRQPSPRASPSASPSGSPAASPRGSREFKAADATSASASSRTDSRVSWRQPTPKASPSVSPAASAAPSPSASPASSRGGSREFQVSTPAVRLQPQPAAAAPPPAQQQRPTPAPAAAPAAAQQQAQKAPPAQPPQQQQQQQAAQLPAPLPEAEIKAFLHYYELPAVAPEALLWGVGAAPSAASSLSGGGDVPKLVPHPSMMQRVAELEHKARRSLMHRYGIAADLVQELLPDLRSAAAAAPHALAWPPAPPPPALSTAAAGGADASAAAAAVAAAAQRRGASALAGLVAVAVWLRLSSLRLLEWNHNYNVKPREISAALDRLGAGLVEVYEAAPQLSGVVLLALASAGRGGEGDMGQRIRDEILAIQSRNGCKGGFMEQWHQKLHNNSSPDDVVICQALLDYLASGQDARVYWATLGAAGITAERLASYDRAITAPPPVFSDSQVRGLTADLTAYRRTLAAVHSGADLSAAIDGVLGYDAGECKGKRVRVEPLAAVATPRLRMLLAALLSLVQGSGGSSPGGSKAGSPSPGKVSAMVDMDRCLQLQALVVEARTCLAPALRGGNKACQGRLRDVLFLDMALELAGRGALESNLGAVRAAAPSTLLGGLLALLQQPVASACLAALPGQAGSAGLVAVLRQLQRLQQDTPGLDATAKARHALSLMQRLRSLLAAAGASTTALLQPTAVAMAGALQLPPGGPNGPVGLLSEEVVRSSAAAALSLLLSAVEPSLRRLAGVSAWSIVSRQPAVVTGTLSALTPCLSQLPAGAITQPTILLLQRLAGEEEVPPGVVGVVVLGDCPDVLSHCAVRARNARIPVVACPASEAAAVAHATGLAGQPVTLSIKEEEVTLSAAPAAAAAAAAVPAAPAAPAAAPSPQPAAPAAAAKPTASRWGFTPPAAAPAPAAPAPPVPAVVPPAALALGTPVGPWDGDWVLSLQQFAPGVVGQKALSTTRLHRAAASGAPGAGDGDGGADSYTAGSGGSKGAAAAAPAPAPAPAAKPPMMLLPAALVASAVSAAMSMSGVFGGGSGHHGSTKATPAASLTSHDTTSSASGGAAAGAPVAAAPLPAWLRLPPSVALAHGSFESVLRCPLNRDLAQDIRAAAARIAQVALAQPGNADACAADLAAVRELVMRLHVPPGLHHALGKHMPELAAAAAAAASSTSGGSAGSSGSSLWSAVTGGGSAGSNSSSSSSSLTSAPAAAGAAAAARGTGGGAEGYEWEHVWVAIKGVWASQWNAHAVAALGKAGLPMTHLRMGVLLQPLLPARYSWVAHTVNPSSGSADEVCVQLVVGLGEVLVGNHPGSALGGTISRPALLAALQQQQAAAAAAAAGSGGGSSGGGGSSAPLPPEAELQAAVDVVTFPSKDAAVLPLGLSLPCCSVPQSSGGGGGAGGGPAVFMARSDSNAEDLPGFAGAGLFDSVPTTPTVPVLIDYSNEPMAWDRSAAAALLWTCGLAAVAAEQALDAQQAQQEGQAQEGSQPQKQGREGRAGAAQKKEGGWRWGSLVGGGGGGGGASSSDAASGSAAGADSASSASPASSRQGLDVEGCITTDGSVWLLQARPQV